MSKEQYFNSIEFLVRNDEEIAALLRKICKHYNLHGKSQDKLRIANLSGNLKQHIHLVFNLECIKSTYIDLKLFFEPFKTKQKQEWIDRIFDITGIRKKLKSEENAERKSREEILIKKLEINFPGCLEQILFLKNEKFLDKYDEKIIFNTLKVYEFIIANETVLDFSELGAKVLNDSKAVREKTEIFNLVYKLLLHNLENSELKDTFENDLAVYEYFNVVANPTAIKVSLFGPFIYYKKGRKFDYIKQLWQIGESAVLSMNNLNGIDTFELEEDFELFTCENESPFNSLIRKSKKMGIIFTSGYPNSAVKKVLELLKIKRENVFHWGDSDFAGYHIASIVNEIIPVKLWRCDIKALKTKKKKLIPINDHERIYKIEQFIIRNSNFVFREELLFTLKYGWLEQENW